MNTRAAQHLLHLGRKISLSPSFLSFFRCFVMLNSEKNDTFSVVLLKFTFLSVLKFNLFFQACAQGWQGTKLWKFIMKFRGCLGKRVSVLP